MGGSRSSLPSSAQPSWRTCYPTSTVASRSSFPRHRSLRHWVRPQNLHLMVGEPWGGGGGGRGRAEPPWHPWLPTPKTYWFCLAVGTSVGVSCCPWAPTRAPSPYLAGVPPTQLQRFGRLGRIDVGALREPLAFLLPAPGEEELGQESTPHPEGEEEAMPGESGTAVQQESAPGGAVLPDIPAATG